jgi:pyridoxamine 5'-phosphate oxidase family protein
VSIFSEAELAYLTGHHLGRLATVNRAGQPHVVPIGYRYNPELDVIELGGYGFGTSKKFRDARQTGKIAFVVDDAGPDGRPRFIELRGTADCLDTGGEALGEGIDPQLIRVRPTRVISYGIEPEGTGASARDV